MALSEAALERRVRYLTASDIPAIMGCKSFRTPLQVWSEKTGKVKPEPIEGNLAIDIGNDFEDALIARAANHCKLAKVVRNQWRVREGTNIASTLDAIGYSSPSLPASMSVVECKTSGIVHSGTDLSGWGDHETSVVPEHVEVQVQTQMLCSGIDNAIISALLGGMGWRLYFIQADVEAQNLILEYCQKWWNDHVVKDVPPADVRPEDNEVLKRWPRVAGKTVVVADSLVEAVNVAKAEAKAAEERKEAAEAALKLALGDAEIGAFSGGQVKYRLEGAGARLNIERLKAELPDVYTKYAEQGTRRVLRISKAKP